MMSMQAHDQRVDEAADVAGDRAEDEPDREAGGDRDDADQQRVSARRRRSARTRRGRAGRRRTSGRRTGPGSSRSRSALEVLLARAERRDQRREDRDHDERDDEEATPTIAPGFCGRRYQASPQRPPPDWPSMQLTFARRFELGRRSRSAQSRIRGLMIAYEMSTTRLTRTKTTARKRIPPCSTG